MGVKNNPSMNEQAIIYGCLKKDPLSQRELFNHFSPKMLTVCYRYASCREDAEDMMQEGFIKVFGQLHTFEGKGAFEGWVRRIMVHTCINILKKHKKFKDCFNLDAAFNLQSVEESVPSILLGRQVLECIRTMPMGYKTVLNLYAIEGFSHREIGEILNIGESTSRSQYTRAKSMLENILINKQIIDVPKKELNLVSI